MGKKPKETDIILIEPENLMADVGQVALLGEDYIVWVKSIEKIKVEPYGKPVLETIPLSDVNSVQYRAIIGIAGILAGLLMLSVGVGFVVAMVAGRFFSLWLIGAAPILVLVGLVLVIGCRRRRLIFSCKDREIPWTSGPLEFKNTSYTMVQVLEWAEKRKITTTDFPDLRVLLGMRK